MTTNTVEVLPSVGVWEIDSQHSTMSFSVLHHATASFRASFYPITGSFDAEAGKLAGQVRVEDIQVPIEPLRQHLQRAEFFDAENHPLITFVSDTVVANGGQVEVGGDLTVKGVTRSVTATGIVREPMLVRHYDGTEAEHFGLDLGLTIDRRVYGVAFNNELPSGRLNLGWEVAVSVALELIKAPEAD